MEHKYIAIDNEIVNWLLENDNPCVRVRTLVELCGFSRDQPAVKEERYRVKQTLSVASDPSWMALNGQILVYNLTALAEAGLSCNDVNIEPVVERLLTQPYDANCADMMALRAMVMLGYGNDTRVITRLRKVEETRLADGGWLCLHRLRKMDRMPKSCIKVSMHGLLLAGELKKRGIEIAGTESLLHYFLKRRLFYRMDRPDQLVLNQSGRRMTDVFFPSEYFHVGLPLLLEALSTLGASQAPELAEAWGLLDGKKDPCGKITLEGTIPTNKSYLPKERVGKPSKWGTLYAYLAWKNDYPEGIDGHPAQLRSF
jgi:hypothetical protein